MCSVHQSTHLSITVSPITQQGSLLLCAQSIQPIYSRVCSLSPGLSLSSKPKIHGRHASFRANSNNYMQNPSCALVVG